MISFGKPALSAFLFLLACGACPPARAGMLFADGVEVDGGGEDSREAYDDLPMLYADMSRYDQIAMEPYRDTYDSLPVDEKARLYGRQFEYLRGRAPNFDPAALNPAADGNADYAEPAGDGGSGAGEDAGDRAAADTGAAGEYDQLPMWFDEMGKYDQIAMEPYRDKYDAMPPGEKAKVYGPQFEFMRGRKPNFHPDILAQMNRFEEEAREDEAISAYQARQYLYKPAEPKKRAGDNAPASQAELLGGISGPWGAAAGGGEGGGAETGAPGKAGQARPDRRMENLRQGWNAADVLRGSRER